MIIIIDDYYCNHTHTHTRRCCIWPSPPAPSPTAARPCCLCPLSQSGQLCRQQQQRQRQRQRHTSLVLQQGWRQFALLHPPLYLSTSWQRRCCSSCCFMVGEPGNSRACLDVCFFSMLQPRLYERPKCVRMGDACVWACVRPLCCCSRGCCLKATHAMCFLFVSTTYNLRQLMLQAMPSGSRIE